MDKRPWVIRQLEPFIYTQNIPITEVIIQHNKGKWFPTTTLIDLDLNLPFEALVMSIDKDNILVQSNKAVRFTAYIY